MSEAAAEDRVIVCHPAEDQILLDFLAAQRATALDIVAGLDEEAWHGRWCRLAGRLRGWSSI